MSWIDGDELDAIRDLAKKAQEELKAAKADVVRLTLQLAELRRVFKEHEALHRDCGPADAS